MALAPGLQLRNLAFHSLQSLPQLGDLLGLEVTCQLEVACSVVKLAKVAGVVAGSVLLVFEALLFKYLDRLLEEVAPCSSLVADLQSPGPTFGATF